MRYAGFIFDLDGTLVDTLGGITAALNEALADAGYPAVTPRQARAIVGDGPRNLCRRAMGPDGDDPAKLDRTLDLFRDRYAAAPVRDTRPFAGVPDVLDRLAPRPIGVCTNKGRRVAEMVLRAFAIDRRLRALVAEDDLPYRKPDPRPLLLLAERLGTAPRETLVVGDGIQDILAAHAAGCPSCAVLQGYTDAHRLLAVGPTLAIRAVRQLPEAVR